MKFLCVALLVALALARNAPHRFHAEHNLMCELCKKTVSHLLTHVDSHQDLTEGGLKDIVSSSKDSVLALCQDGGEDADCSAPCQMILEELNSGEFSRFESSSVTEVCQTNNWCHTDETLKTLKELPSQYPEMINYINRIQNSWTADVYERWNQSSRHDYRRFLGTIVDEELKCKLKHVDNSYYSGVPDSFDSEENWPDCKEIIGDIRDQSNCGCCWAFGAASAASDRMCIATKAQMKFPLSAQATCFCPSMNGCNGGQVFTPWNFFKSDGVVSGGQFNGTGPAGLGMCSDFTLPHCHHHGPQGDDPYPAEGQPGCPSQRSAFCPRRCLSTATSPHDKYASDEVTFDGQVKGYESETAIQNAIMTDGPVETAFTVYEDFANYVSGVYRHITGSVEGGHAVRIVGWGVDGTKKYWKVANSWNPYWGEKGYFRIRRGTDECGIESQAMATSSGASWGPKNGLLN